MPSAPDIEGNLKVISNEADTEGQVRAVRSSKLVSDCLGYVRLSQAYDWSVVSYRSWDNHPCRIREFHW